MKHLVLALALTGTAAHADPGYLNQAGCHYGTTDGWRGMWHCHHMARSYYNDRGLQTDPPVVGDPVHDRLNNRRTNYNNHNHNHNHNNNNDALNVLLGIIVLDALLGK